MFCFLEVALRLVSETRHIIKIKVLNYNKRSETLAVFIVLLFGVIGAENVSKDKDAVVSIGRLYAVDSTTGNTRRIYKRDVQAMTEDENHHIRLRFEDDDITHLDMNIQGGSVWDIDSVLVIRRGGNTFQPPQYMNKDCHLYGHVSSHGGGGVSLNRCGRMMGNIRAAGHDYELEEMTPAENDEHHHTQFKVTKRISDEEVADEIERGVFHSVQKREIPVEDNDNTTRVKRRVPQISIELAVFADNKYVEYLRDTKGLRSLESMQAWFINKWNMVQGVFRDTAVVGASVRIQLKMIELWWEKPAGYPRNNVKFRTRTSWFCENTPSANRYDMKVLYVKDKSGNDVGMSRRGGVCQRNYKCFVIKSLTTGVKRELNEMGRVLGFPRDSEFSNCNGNGFMGSTRAYRFLPCYRRRLQSIIRNENNRCLRRKNVQTPKLTTSLTPDDLRRC